MPEPQKILLLLLLLVAGLPVGQAAAPDRTVIQLTVDGAIGPATQDYIDRALQYAAERRLAAIVIRMDTPGGLDSAMRSIIKQVTGSPVPVVTYVAPTGARAASAGTYILYASHVAAMAPGTNLGAATPVRIGEISPPAGGDKDGDGKPRDAAGGDAMKNKMINDAVAYIRGLAELHGRNQDWAEQAVREAASLPAGEALRLNVIDIVASGMSDLLEQLEGREITVLGKQQTLHTGGLLIEQYAPDWRNRLLAILTNPNVAYILMLVGIYGLIFEFSNPGAIVPGTVGAIALLLALYAFQLLPINFAGVALILLGVALMVAEAFQPSFGVLGIGGLASFVMGSIILIDTETPGFGVDYSVIAVFSATSAAMFIFVIGLAMKARRRPVVSGREELIGGQAVVIDGFDQSGNVTIHSETWRARSEVPLCRGQQVRVTGVDGLILQVKPLDDSQQEGKT